MLGSDLDNNFVALPSIGASGGILVPWRAKLGVIGASRLDNYSVSVQFCPEHGSPWWLTCVYGPQGNEAKIEFLKELRNIHMQCVGSWALVGDFNLIYMDEDKNNSNLNRTMMGHFRKLINDLAIKELPLHGRKYTWAISNTSLPLLSNSTEFSVR